MALKIKPYVVIQEGDSTDSTEEAENSSIKEHNEEEKTGNAGWVDSISKILKTNKPKGKKTLVLSKAKKLTDVKKDNTDVKQTDFEIQGGDGEVRREKIVLAKALDKVATEGPPRKKKKEIKSLRVKPNILEKDREKTLSKIATRGVVQLFNTVRMQKKDADTKLKEAGPLEVRKEKVMRSIDKKVFLDVLMGEKSQTVDSNVTVKEDTQENQTWSVLRDDFMIMAKLKDWDKQLEKELEPENVETE